ncbi:MAG: hypothetical protein P8099_04855 [Gemmatimonadota bacterium]|jgi:hypothetical protein
MKFDRKAVQRWVREFAVIVLGVLVALWVSDWSQGHQERQREQIDLQQLLATTRDNERRVVAAINEDSSALAVAYRLLAALHATTALPPEDTLSAWRTEAFHFSVFFPMTGTYTAIAQTGDLNLIRNDSVRAQIASYAGILAGTAKQIEDWTGTFHRNVQDLIQTVPIQGVWGAAFAEPTGPTTWRAPALERALFMQTIISQNRVSDLRQLLDATRALRRSLEATLRNGG